MSHDNALAAVTGYKALVHNTMGITLTALTRDIVSAFDIIPGGDIEGRFAKRLLAMRFVWPTRPPRHCRHTYCSLEEALARLEHIIDEWKVSIGQ
jgi:hypothetical protein